jgi:hypothetical protein
MINVIRATVDDIDTISEVNLLYIDYFSQLRKEDPVLSKIYSNKFSEIKELIYEYNEYTDILFLNDQILQIFYEIINKSGISKIVKIEDITREFMSSNKITNDISDSIIEYIIENMPIDQVLDKIFEFGEDSLNDIDKTVLKIKSLNYNESQ